VWWRGKVDIGRQLAGGEYSPGVANATPATNAAPATAFFEWAAPDGANVLDEDVWWSCHPALAEGHVPIEVIRADAVAMSVAEFGRAYCNTWSDLLDGGWSAIDENAWKAAKA
jgi:hypothetical protein